MHISTPGIRAHPMPHTRASMHLQLQITKFILHLQPRFNSVSCCSVPIHDNSFAPSRRKPFPTQHAHINNSHHRTHALQIHIRTLRTHRYIHTLLHHTLLHISTATSYAHIYSTLSHILPHPTTYTKDLIPQCRHCCWLLRRAID